jgi:hypothetical protein
MPIPLGGLSCTQVSDIGASRAETSPLVFDRTQHFTSKGLPVAAEVPRLAAGMSAINAVRWRPRPSGRRRSDQPRSFQPSKLKLARGITPGFFCVVAGRPDGVTVRRQHRPACLPCEWNIQSAQGWLCKNNSVTRPLAPIAACHPMESGGYNIPTIRHVRERKANATR